MIQQLDITGVHMTVGEDLRKYIAAKIGRLDRYIPRAARESAHVAVSLKEVKAKDKKECHCEVTIRLPHEVLHTQDDTINMFAAVDIAEEKLKSQLRRYKELHASPRLHQRMLARVKRRPVEA